MMKLMQKGIILVTACLALGGEGKNFQQSSSRPFPDGFRFGAATSAYQVEGAWDEDGKSENIWDHVVHSDLLFSVVADGSNGDIADDSYHNIERDVEMMRELGLDFYRFSISWTRIIPTSFPNEINEAGVDYYNRLINEMLRYNIEPIITLYHWDLPHRLQELGGWANPHMADWFADFARVAYEAFGDRVKYWVTINEPKEICNAGFKMNIVATELSGYVDYLCAKNVLMAHASAYHIYDQEFRSRFGGSVGIVLSGGVAEPETDADIEAAEDHAQFDWGIYAHPIYSETGNFPQAVIDRVAAKSAEQGFRRSRLPALTEEEVEYIRGTGDFFGFNYYTNGIVYRNESVVGMFPVPSNEDDVGVVYYQPSDWEFGANSWFGVNPRGFHRLLTKIREDYNNPPVFITENGYSSRPEDSMADDRRVQYYIRYLDAMLDAMDEGSNVVRYTAWTLMDNFEWISGYLVRYGIYDVDFTDPARTRTPRKSAFFYKDLLRARALDVDWDIDYDAAVMTIDEGH